MPKRNGHIINADQATVAAILSQLYDLAERDGDTVALDTVLIACVIPMLSLGVSIEVLLNNVRAAWEQIECKTMQLNADQVARCSVIRGEA